MVYGKCFLHFRQRKEQLQLKNFSREGICFIKEKIIYLLNGPAYWKGIIYPKSKSEMNLTQYLITSLITKFLIDKHQSCAVAKYSHKS